MKKNYIAPIAQVTEVQTEYLMTGSNLSGKPADGSTPLIKGERFDIDFTDISGQEIVKKNPWDNQW